MKPLHEQIALVTGASRGAGRGIAAELGGAGAVVYVMTAAFRPRRRDGRSRRPGGPKETPVYLGRAICALASDPQVLEKSGQLLEVGALAREYSFTDADGSQPAPFRMPGLA
jgi:NAD(P)-dependent dehydrogenase (short-subunit alcohol dehydrogenase family)